MGTRADFYVGKGETAEWLGSIGWDGYRDGIDEAVLAAHSEAEFRAALHAFFCSRDDVTRPCHGWPWPWDDSSTSDCSYWFVDGKVWDEHDKLLVPLDRPEPDWSNGDEDALRRDWLAGCEPIVFPNMSALRKEVAMDERSGLIVVSSK